MVCNKKNDYRKREPAGDVLVRVNTESGQKVKENEEEENVARGPRKKQELRLGLQDANRWRIVKSRSFFLVMFHEP